MKIRTIIVGLCIGLMLDASIPKFVKAEPLTIWAFVKVLGVLAGIGGFWIAMERATLADHDSATESLIKHLENNSEFPVNNYCQSPDIRNGIVKEGWIVSIDDKKYLYPVVKSEFCKAGGISKNGKYIIGIFVSKYQAENFAKVVKYRTDNEIDVYIGGKAIKF